MNALGPRSWLRAKNSETHGERHHDHDRGKQPLAERAGRAASASCSCSCTASGALLETPLSISRCTVLRSAATSFASG